ncbi:MAG: Smr/MutS family protein [Saprospiraceae bacterium]
MLNPTELWIGERLKNKENGLIGTFEGLDSPKVLLVKIDDQIQKIHLDFLELAPEEEIPNPFEILNDELSKNNNILHQFKNSIDLHIEILNPNLIHERQERIYKEQLEAFEQFISIAKSANMNYIIVIHGKGEGILRAEIQSRLKLEYQAKIILTIHDGGATEAWL